MRAAINTIFRQVPVWAVWLAGAVPVLWLTWLLVSGGLGADPVKRLEHGLGEWGLYFLIASLAVTPVLRLGRINLMRFRRALGLLGFVYICLHVAVWLVLDIQLRWEEIWRDILKRPYVTVGMAGFALLIPLAWTSRDSALRRMGAVRWNRLHRLAYPAILLGSLHYLMLVKAWPPGPILCLGLVLGLLAFRILPRFHRLAGAR
jgi:sulfoxide reductase heme-binding subunit YedZ